jgi:hypothetical protein
MLLLFACNHQLSDTQPISSSSVPLVSNLCGSGTSAVWFMQNTSTGSVTQLKCNIQSKDTEWGCYISSGSGVGAIAELDYTKSDAATYWNPGLSENLKWILYNDPVFGWKPVIAYVLDFNNQYLATIYYYSIPPGGPGEPLFQNGTNTKIGWLSIQSFDNSCQSYPGEVPPSPDWQPYYVDGGYQYKNGQWNWLTGQWTTVVDVNDSIPCDGIVDYCGPAISLSQHEGAYDDYAVDTVEKWWFSDDPTGKQPRLLKKVLQTVYNGASDDITIETTSTTLSESIARMDRPTTLVRNDSSPAGYPSGAQDSGLTFMMSGAALQAALRKSRASSPLVNFLVRDPR